MSSYHAMDGGGDDDDADIVISEGCENIEKFTRRMHSKIALLESRDSPTLRKQIEEEHRKGQDVIAEIKAVIRRAPRKSRVIDAEREFRQACEKFRQAYHDFNGGGSVGRGARINTDDSSGNFGGGHISLASGGGGSQQSLTLDMIESEDVDALLEQENREDALRLARDTAILRETMADTHALIEEGKRCLL